MSFQEIIIQVQNKPELWLSSHSLYKNKIVKSKVWKELAIKLGIEEDALKKRWKHLKDQYRKELKKHPIPRSGTESETRTSTWQYFNIMSFVKDEVASAPSTDDLNINETESTHETENGDMENDTDISGSVPLPISYHVLSPTGSSGSQLSSSARKHSNIKHDMLEIEKKKLLLMETRLRDTQRDEKLKNDEDFLFLKSILPSMKKLNQFQKLRFRGKINDWLLEALTENERDVRSSSAVNGDYYPQPDSDLLI